MIFLILFILFVSGRPAESAVIERVNLLNLTITNDPEPIPPGGYLKFNGQQLLFNGQPLKFNP